MAADTMKLSDELETQIRNASEIHRDEQQFCPPDHEHADSGWNPPELTFLG